MLRVATGLRELLVRQEVPVRPEVMELRVQPAQRELLAQQGQQVPPGWRARLG